MKTGFLLGILAGGVVAAAVVWVVPELVAPDAPESSAVTGETGRIGAAPSPSAEERLEAPDPAARAEGGAAPPAPSPSAEERLEAPDPAAGAEGGAAPPAVTAATEPDRLAAVAPTDAAPAGEAAEASPAAAPDSAAAPDAGAAPNPAAAPDPADDAPEAEAEANPPADPRAPAFDVVRVDPGGQTVLAGRAAPGETVEVLLDGDVVDEVQVDESGKFVAVLSAESTGAARELQLRVAVPEAGLGPAPHAATPSTPALPAAEAEPRATPPAGALRQSQPSSTGPGESPEPPASAVPGPPLPPQVGGASAPTTPASDSADALAARDPSALRLASGGRSVAPAAGDAPAGASPATPPTGQRYLFSAPVIILPSQQADDAPAVVEAGRDQLAMLQPQGGAVEGVVLDQLTYDPQGRVVLSGRAQPGHAVRIYGNGGLLGTAPTADGTWQLALSESRARDLQLLRFDEIDRGGQVTSRIEAPFEYSAGPPRTVQNREIVIERGDNLWRIAEQVYGEGIRYSVIFGANRNLIRDPDLIYPDQVFTIPELVEAE